MWLIENYSCLGVLVCKSLGKITKNKRLKFSFYLF
nr:MAG TPA: GCM motif protein [Caudoviricetes sp.]